MKINGIYPSSDKNEIDKMNARLDGIERIIYFGKLVYEQGYFNTSRNMFERALDEYLKIYPEDYEEDEEDEE